ncbi:MAG TPA: hypothetical protein VFD06_06285 [Candidatus Polarisedimenticolia bacterium]|nr:hypothetical protein [Candidatus Polarisedimenticolia bacterium]
MAPLLAGAGLCLLAFVVWLVTTHFRERPWFDRPGFARWRGFDALASLLRWALFAAGLLALSAHSGAGAAVAVGLFLFGLGWRLAARSAALKRRAMRRALVELRSKHPGEPETELLVRLVLAAHPRWGEELVRQMALDNPDVDDMARVVARMEQGFRGFR